MPSAPNPGYIEAVSTDMNTIKYLRLNTSFRLNTCLMCSTIAIFKSTIYKSYLKRKLLHYISVTRSNQWLFCPIFPTCRVAVSSDFALIYFVPSTLVICLYNMQLGRKYAKWGGFHLTTQARTSIYYALTFTVNIILQNKREKRNQVAFVFNKGDKLCLNVRNKKYSRIRKKDMNETWK